MREIAGRNVRSGARDRLLVVCPAGEEEVGGQRLDDEEKKDGTAEDSEAAVLLLEAPAETLPK